GFEAETPIEGVLDELVPWIDQAIADGLV
ncbi:uncharacterized protein METZ01_LOCUS367795, partial [marine metagenome]